jgi:hypothetical protein
VARQNRKLSFDALLVGPRAGLRLGERLLTKTIAPLSRLLPPRIQNSFITEAENLATRMLAAEKAAPPGTHIIVAKDI